MILAIPDVLDADGVARIRAILDAADWIDGNETSGAQSALAKRNLQLPEMGAAAQQAGNLVLDALGQTARFIAAAPGCALTMIASGTDSPLRGPLVSGCSAPVPDRFTAWPFTAS